MFSSTLRKSICKTVAFGASGLFLYIGAKKSKSLLASEIGKCVISNWDYNWDSREIKSTVNPKKLREAIRNDDSSVLEKLIHENTPTAKRHLIFIRHGQYYVNGKTDSDRFLTNLGKEQAEATAKRIKELNLNITRIVQSSMTRAIETRAIISNEFPGVEVETYDLLREGAPIPPIPPKRSWEPQSKYHADGPRIEAAFKQFFHRADVSQSKDSYEIFVGHANVIRYFICRALQFPPEAWLRINLNHGSITIFTIFPNGEVVVSSIGDSGHMSKKSLTYSNSIS